MKTKIKIYAMLRADKLSMKNGTCPIYFFVRCAGKTYKFPSEHAIEEKLWLDRRRLTKDDSINVQLKKKIVPFEEWVNQMQTNKKPVTPELIKEFFQGVDYGSFLDYYDRKIKGELNDLGKNTIKGYQSNLNVLKLFKSKISFADLDLEFIKNFYRYLTNTRGITDGGCFGHCKNLKAILNRAKMEKRIKDNPFDEGFTMPKVPSRLVWIDEKEIKAWEKLQIPSNCPDLESARQMFLFACYTSLRYSDLVSLEWKNIKKEKVSKREMIVKMQVKTKREVFVPLSVKALEILKQRKGISPTKVFDNVSNQKLNRHLEKMAETLKMDKKITSHVGRHSFASNAVIAGIDIYKVSKVMGHSNIGQTQPYAKLSKESLFEVVDRFTS